MDKFGVGCFPKPGQISQPNMPGCIGCFPSGTVIAPYPQIPTGVQPVGIGGVVIGGKPNGGISGSIGGVPKKWF